MIFTLPVPLNWGSPGKLGREISFNIIEIKNCRVGGRTEYTMVGRHWAWGTLENLLCFKL